MVVTRNELSEIVEQVNAKFEELEKTIKELKACSCSTEKQKTLKTAKKAA
jgi:hypothetical protein|tara:strand:+ start:348 stop:497 length:150 start_codon:yes stop_codon:yes gene_type:complete